MKKKAYTCTCSIFGSSKGISKQLKLLFKNIGGKQWNRRIFFLGWHSPETSQKLDFFTIAIRSSKVYYILHRIKFRAFTPGCKKIIIPVWMHSFGVKTVLNRNTSYPALKKKKKYKKKIWKIHQQIKKKKRTFSVFTIAIRSSKVYYIF